MQTVIMPMKLHIQFHKYKLSGSSVGIDMTLNSFFHVLLNRSIEHREVITHLSFSL